VAFQGYLLAAGYRDDERISFKRNQSVNNF